jgi:hypothetical protein
MNWSATMRAQAAIQSYSFGVDLVPRLKYPDLVKASDELFNLSDGAVKVAQHVANVEASRSGSISNDIDWLISAVPLIKTKFANVIRLMI